MIDSPSTPNPDHIAERAWALIELRRWKEAVAEAQRALLLNPRHFNGLYNLTVAQRRSGDAVGAEQTARTLISYYPNNASAYNMLSRALKDQQRYTDAIAASRESVQLNPGDADLWINLSDVLMSARLFNEGLEACEKAIELNPNVPMAHNNYAVGLEEFHRDTEAEAEYSKAMELDPLNALFHSNLGWLKHKQKNYHAAAQHFHAALKLAPTHREYQRSLERTLGRAYPIGKWFTLMNVGLGLLPFVLLAITISLGAAQLAGGVFVISLAGVVVYVLFISSKVESRLRTRYLHQKILALDAKQTLQL